MALISLFLVRSSPGLKARVGSPTCALPPAHDRFLKFTKPYDEFDHFKYIYIFTILTVICSYPSLNKRLCENCMILDAQIGHGMNGMNLDKYEQR